jgi:hypothetical protein
MGVTWQNNDTYQAIKRSERDTGISFAQQNANMNPNGVHNIWGVRGVSLFNGISQFCMQNAPNWVNGGGGGDASVDVDSSVSTIKDFNKLLTKYNSAKDADKAELKSQLRTMAEANPDNLTIKKAWKSIEGGS